MLGMWCCLRAEMLTSPEVTAAPGLVQSVIVQEIPEKSFLVCIKYLEVPLLIWES